jgi:peptidoglycan glycosyltransferase
MNAPIARLYAFLLLLFGLLVLFTSNWAVFDAEDLEARAENKRPLLEQQKIKRGEVRSSDGELLAVSEPIGRGEKKRFVRSYPAGELFGHPLGYD